MPLALFEDFLLPFSVSWRLPACVFSLFFFFFFKQVEEFHVLSKEILSLPAKAYFAMIHLDCEELKQGLAKKAKNFAEKLLERMITTHRQKTLKLATFVNFNNKNKPSFLVKTIVRTSVNMNFFLFWRICSEFETIRETALKTPESTVDIIQLVDFINYTKTEGIEELKEKIQVGARTFDSIRRWCTLIDHVSRFRTALCSDRTSAVDCSICVTFTLLRRMKWSWTPQFLRGRTKSSASFSSVTRYCSLARGSRRRDRLLFHTGCQQVWLFQVIETAKEKGMDELMVKRGGLKVQLEKVLRRIAEFPFFSELDMIEQVGVCLACLDLFSSTWMEDLVFCQPNCVFGKIRPLSFKVYVDCCWILIIATQGYVMVHSPPFFFFASI